MSQVQVSQFDYSAPTKVIATYRYRQVPADSPATLSFASTWNCSFTLPRGSVYNLSRSYITFTVSLTTDAAANANAVMVDMLPIQNIRVRTERGVLLEDIQDAHILSRSRPLFQSKDDLNKSSKFFGNAGTAQFTDTGLNYVPAGKLMVDVDGKTASATNGVGFKNEAGTLVDYSHDRDYRQWLVGETGDAKTNEISYKIPLSEFIGLTSIDRDLFHANEALIIELVMLAGNDYLTQVVGANGITTTAADYPQAVATANFNNTPTLQLAVQSNNQVAQDLITLVNTQGLKVNYPYVWLQKRSTGATTSFDDIYKLNISRGKRLLRVLYALGTDGTKATGKHSTVNNNADARRVVSARSSLNAAWEQDSLQDTSVWFDEMKNSLGNSAVENIRAFRRAGFIMKDYTSSATVEDFKAAQTQEVGLSLIEPIDVAIQYTKSATAQNSFIYAICQRSVAFLPTGVSEA